MALREKSPNIYTSDARDPRWEVRKPKAPNTGASIQIKSEKIPFSSGGHKCAPALQQQDQSTELDKDVNGFLTDKWKREASQTSLPTPAPPIQRGQLSVLPQQRGRHHVGRSGTHFQTGVFKAYDVEKGDLENGCLLGNIYIDENEVFDNLVSSRNNRIQPKYARGMVFANLAGQPSNRADLYSHHVELERLGHTRPGISLFGDSETETSALDPRKFRTTSVLSNKQKQVNQGMDFLAAVRHNLGSMPMDGSPHNKPADCRAKEEKDPLLIPSQLGPTQSIRSLTQSKQEGSAEYAEFLLRKMLCDYHEGVTNTPPDGGCFNSVVHAYAFRGDATKAEGVLALMWHEFYRGNLPPDKRIFTTVMYAWQRSEKKLEAPEACEYLLRQMHQLHDTGVAPSCGPDTFTYTCILHCWANSERADAADRAESLFRAMLQRFEAGDENLKPDTICYSNLINVFVNCGNKYNDAERVLWEMVDVHVAGLHSVAPTVRSFNTLLAVWSKSNIPEAPERVHSILQRWKDLKRQKKIEVSPDDYSYALLLKAWAKASRPDAVEQLLESFEWIKKLYEVGEESARPDIIKYTTVIGALNKAGQVERAYVLLGELIHKYKECKDKKYKPDHRCFHIILSAFSRNKGNVSLGTKAESLLRRMWELEEFDPNSDLRPTQWTYSTVIFCYQNVGDPWRAERLLKEMNHLAKSGRIDRGADIRTYKAVLQAWRMSNEQTKQIHIRSLQEEVRTTFYQQI